MNLLTIFLEEIGRFLIVLVIASMLLFGIVHSSPGSASSLHLEYRTRSEDSSLISQYSNWAKNLILHRDLGKTKHGDDIFSQILSKGKNSAFLILLALFTSILWSALFLFLSAKTSYPASVLIRISPHIVSMVPIFLAGYFFRHLFPSLEYFETFEESEFPIWSYYLIPAIILGIGDGFLSEMIRHSKAELSRIRSENYIHMARAKGARMWRHIKNDFIIHISRLITSRFVILISGAVIIEYIFGLPGIGSLAFNAAESRDIKMLLGITVLVVFVVSGLNLVNRLTALTLDPRLRET